MARSLSIQVHQFNFRWNLLGFIGHIIHLAAKQGLKILGLCKPPTNVDAPEESDNNDRDNDDVDEHAPDLDTLPSVPGTIIVVSGFHPLTEVSASPSRLRLVNIRSRLVFRIPPLSLLCTLMLDGFIIKKIAQDSTIMFRIHSIVIAVHSSSQRRAAFQDVAKIAYPDEKDVEKLMLIQDVTTRWNSSYCNESISCTSVFYVHT